VDPLARFHLPWLPCLLSSSLAFLPSSALFLFVCLIWIPDADDALRVTDRIVFLYSFLFFSFLFFVIFFLSVCLFGEERGERRRRFFEGFPGFFVEHPAVGAAESNSW